MPKKELALTATVTSKGQVTIPSAVRRELGLVTGSKVRFEGSRVTMRIMPEKAPASFCDFVGWGNPGIPEGMSAMQWMREIRGYDDLD